MTINPQIRNRFVQLIRVGCSIRHEWVNIILYSDLSEILFSGIKQHCAKAGPSKCYQVLALLYIPPTIQTYSWNLSLIFSSCVGSSNFERSLFFQIV